VILGVDWGVDFFGGFGGVDGEGELVACKLSPYRGAIFSIVAIYRIAAAIYSVVGYAIYSTGDAICGTRVS
jgi:hypothetical protein